jgi:hypothetical protein
VAANPGVTLRRLSMAGPGIFGRFWQEISKEACPHRDAFNLPSCLWVSMV